MINGNIPLLWMKKNALIERMGRFLKIFFKILNPGYNEYIPYLFYLLFFSLKLQYNLSIILKLSVSLMLWAKVFQALLPHVENSCMSDLLKTCLRLHSFKQQLTVCSPFIPRCLLWELCFFPRDPGQSTTGGLQTWQL